MSSIHMRTSVATLFFVSCLSLVFDAGLSVRQLDDFGGSVTTPGGSFQTPDTPGGWARSGPGWGIGVGIGKPTPPAPTPPTPVLPTPAPATPAAPAKPAAPTPPTPTGPATPAAPTTPSPKPPATPQPPPTVPAPPQNNNQQHPNYQYQYPTCWSTVGPLHSCGAMLYFIQYANQLPQDCCNAIAAYDDYCCYQDGPLYWAAVGVSRDLRNVCAERCYN